MSGNHDFCDHCPECRPAFLDLATGEPLAADSPTMKIVNRIWDQETSYAERKAFILVTINKSKTKRDVLLAGGLIMKFQQALKGVSA